MWLFRFVVVFVFVVGVSLFFSSFEIFMAVPMGRSEPTVVVSWEVLRFVHCTDNPQRHGTNQTLNLRS